MAGQQQIKTRETDYERNEYKTGYKILHPFRSEIYAFYKNVKIFHEINDSIIYLSFLYFSYLNLKKAKKRCF